MRIQVTLDVEVRNAPGWDTPADADEVAEWITASWTTFDVEENAVAFEVTGVEVRVVES